MLVSIRSCRDDELDAVVRCLDYEFILSRERVISLQRRFPKALSRENRSNVYIATAQNDLCGAYVLKLFDWISEGKVWKGAMIGMVWVSPRYRGRGIGRQLLASIEEVLHRKRVDFGVLWTASHSFYEKGGWVASDLGLFGEAKGSKRLVKQESIICNCIASSQNRDLEEIRKTMCAQRIVRSTIDYASVPVPADRVLVFRSTKENASTGFALVGENSSSGYLYELTAPYNLWDSFWQEISNRYKKLLVNGMQGTPFAFWLSQNNQILWTQQNKTMWLRVSRRSKSAPIKDWHIPYFDWI
jgi:GNAT superfamily N-acetyltransferase